MTEQIQKTTFTAHDHSTIINRAGIILIGYPNKWGARFEPKAAIAHAEYLLAHREELEQLQQDLEQTWLKVALEIKSLFERREGRDGISFAEASSYDIEDTLEVLSGRDASGKYVQAPEGLAGHWYRSMWNEDGDSVSYEQEWTPFLRVCQELQMQTQKALQEKVERESSRTPAQKCSGTE